MEISVVIPAYNEENRIISTLEKLVVYLKRKKFDYEIIVVDDGSKDNTINVVEQFAKKTSNPNIKIKPNKVNHGKGYSVRQGMLAARKQYVLFSDADLSTPITELDKFLPFIKKYDIVIGSRRMKQSLIVTRQPFYRRIPGQVFPIVVNFLLIRGINDTQCGFKLFKRTAAQRIFRLQKLERFSFDAEVLLLGKKLGYKIKEVPVVWVNALDSKLNAVTDSVGMFVELLKVRYNLAKGNYKFSKLKNNNV